MPRRPRHPAPPAARIAIAGAVCEALEPRRLLAAVYAVDFGFDAHPQRVDYTPLVPPAPPGTRGAYVPPRRPPWGAVFPNTGDPYVLTNLTTDATVDRATLALGPGAAAGSFALTAPGLPRGVFADGNYELLLPVEESIDPAAVPRVVEEPHAFWNLAGDINRDRLVDDVDFGILQAHYLQAGAAYADGDLTGDGAVGFPDLAILQHSYGLRLPPPPSASNSTTAAAHPDGTVSVQWTAPADGTIPDGYRVYRSTDGTNFAKVAEVPDPAARAWTDAGPLAQGNRYWYRVRPYTAAAGSALTTNKFWAVTPLPAPAGLTATAVSPTEVALNWSDAGDGTATFAVQMDLGNGVWGTPYSFATGANGLTQATSRVTSTGRTSATVTGMTPGTASNFRVIAKTADAQSAPSDPVSVTMPVAAPLSFAATSAGPTSVALTWQHPGGSGGVGGFRATLHPRNGGADVVASFAAGATGGTVSGLTPNTEFDVTLDALAPAGSAAAETAYAGEAPTVRTDPLLTLRAVLSGDASEGREYGVYLNANGYAVRKWLLDWGDGVKQVVAPSGLSPDTYAGHTYADDADYKVTATVADEWGTFAAEPLAVKVRDVPASLLVYPFHGGGNVYSSTSAFSILLVNSDPGVLDVPTYSINWGDGNTTGAGPDGHTAYHVYQGVGERTIRVTATDPKGAVAEAAPLVVVDGGAASTAGTPTQPAGVDNVTPTPGRDAAGKPVMYLAWRDTSFDAWITSNNRETDFIIERKEQGERGASTPDYVQIGTSPANTPFFTDTTAAPGVGYLYRVFARNAKGRGGIIDGTIQNGLIPLPRVGVFSDVPVAGERAGDPGQFAFERDGNLSQELRVSFEVPTGDETATAGEDYEQMVNPVVFLAGQSQAFLPLMPKWDGILEATEQVTLKILPADALIRLGGLGLLGIIAKAEIKNENPEVQVITGSAGNGPGTIQKAIEEVKDKPVVFTVRFQGRVPAQATEVLFKLQGSATIDEDYTVEAPGLQRGDVENDVFKPKAKGGDFFTVPVSGNGGTVIKVVPKDDATAEGLETVNLVLEKVKDSGYNVAKEKAEASGGIEDKMWITVLNSTAVDPNPADNVRYDAKTISGQAVVALKAIAPEFEFVAQANTPAAVHPNLEAGAYVLYMDWEPEDLVRAEPKAEVQANLVTTKAKLDHTAANSQEEYNKNFANAIEAIPSDGRGKAFGHTLVKKAFEKKTKILGVASQSKSTGSTVEWNPAEVAGADQGMHSFPSTTAHTLGHELIHIVTRLYMDEAVNKPLKLSEHRKVASYENMLRYESGNIMKQWQYGAGWVAGKPQGTNDFVSLITLDLPNA